MAWRSFYLSAGVVCTVTAPFYAGTMGAGYLPDGPCIVAANHSSFLDGPFLAAAYARAKFKPLHMIAYEEPFRNWFMGYFLRSGRCIPFQRGNRQSQAVMLKTALGWLAAGEAVGVFPEGHINQKPRLKRPRPGAALLALETGRPVIPAAIIGSSATLPLAARVPRPWRRVHIRFGSPVLMFEKERQYKQLPRNERKKMAADFGYRIMTAIGLLANKEPHA